MNYGDEWRAISARIDGLMKAAQFHTSLLTARDSDIYGRATYLRKQTMQIRDALMSIQDEHRQSLPPAVLTALESFLREIGELLIEGIGTLEVREEKAQAALLKLLAFEGQLTFLLRNNQELLRSRADRAFEHLQCSIVTDETLRTKWQTAFNGGEVPCEQLGAVHLLWHGIWAFKVNAAGGRTDLVTPQKRKEKTLHAQWHRSRAWRCGDRC